ncbi:bile acid:sodium symporter family protein [Paeniglutamicibacter sp. NPDC012692]|uniref:bile acid:sodium symporter family protein n=1 Tax=Paeniglutamicibacter sp. NPDC012692 TaxID=3364388 RepID=UPI003696CD1D
MLTVFGFGLRATIADVLYVVRRPRILVISLVSMFIVMPFVALVLALLVDPPRVALVALVTLALSPVPPTLLGKEHDPGGRASYGLGLTVTVSILSIVLIPALVLFLGSLTDNPFNVGFAAVARQVLLAVVLPLVAGMLVRAFLPRLAERVEKPFALVAKVVLLAAVVFVLVAAFPQFLEVLTARTVVAFVAFTVLGLAFGHIMAGPNPSESRVLALASSLRHPGIALAIATLNFPSMQFGAVIILYLIVGTIVCIPYMKWMQKRSATRLATNGKS